MRSTKIEWCDSTWNPVSGCLNDCPYCYAKKIARRFGRQSEGDVHVLNEPLLLPDGRACAYPYGFDPVFFKYRLVELKDRKPQRVFVCSMADLFGEWIPDEWIHDVFKACGNAPQHHYFFLTKNPMRYMRLNLSNLLPRKNNFWYGTTVENGNQLGVAFRSFRYNTFVSMEPLLGRPSSYPDDYAGIDWFIIGAETGNRKGKIAPEKEWVLEAAEMARDHDSFVFMKDSLLPVVGEENMIKELPDFK